jgi:C-terminal processing protease CtpA/Prc
MKIMRTLLIAIIFGSLTTSCFEDRDDNVILSSSIHDFVWKGMNAVYLYKAEIPDLANDRFTSNEEYGNYLNSFSSPEELFESLIYQRQTVDRFSIIVDDYIALQQALSGVSKSNGLEFNFYYEPGSTTDVFGIIRLVLNNSEASNLGLQRGQIIHAVDGVELTESNLSSLFGQDTYTLHFADYNDNGTTETDDDSIVSNGSTSSLTKVEYTENPVHTTEIINVGGENVGYLLYNGFTADFNNQLNNAFADFQANNVQHLVLDLRYNGGGSVDTARLLGSMITGQFNGSVFSKLNYNDDLQELNSTFNFTNSFNGNSINSLNLDKVYVLTTNRSASASEMIINSLGEYIDVVHIGDNTTGKSQASVTIYDSPDLGPNDVNPNHTYAMQPLVAISVNANDGVVPSSGLVPDVGFEINESVLNFGILGDENEPLLAAALADIESSLGRYSIDQSIRNTPQLTPVKKDINLKPFEDEMYIDNEFISIIKKEFNQ